MSDFVIKDKTASFSVNQRADAVNRVKGWKGCFLV